MVVRGDGAGVEATTDLAVDLLERPRGHSLKRWQLESPKKASGSAPAESSMLATLGSGRSRSSPVFRKSRDASSPASVVNDDELDATENPTWGASARGSQKEGRLPPGPPSIATARPSASGLRSRPGLRRRSHP
ncbi:MAG: hypothetical protein C4306_02335 [Thermoleophilia bacterium]